MTPLILASTSKTRIDMLTKSGVVFFTEKPLTDEKGLRDSLVAEGASGRNTADALAEAKARSVSLIKPEAYVLGADQILEKDGKIYEKAPDREAARNTLLELSDAVHQLHSAAVIYQGGQAVWRFTDTAKLHVRPLSEEYVDMYLDKLGEDAFWSVGAYQLEGLGAQLFTRVEGSHFTVLGLPLLPVLDFFRRVGIVPL